MTHNEQLFVPKFIYACRDQGYPTDPSEWPVPDYNKVASEDEEYGEQYFVESHNPWMSDHFWQTMPTFLTGVEFEHFLACLLRIAGFDAKTTKQSHDYGVDLTVPTPAGKVAIQSKNFAKAIGYGAVMEVHAGRVMYRCQHAAVVTPIGFRKRTIRLADQLGVHLFESGWLLHRIANDPHLFVAHFLAHGQPHFYGALSKGEVVLCCAGGLQEARYYRDDLWPIRPIESYKAIYKRWLAEKGSMADRG